MNPDPLDHTAALEMLKKAFTPQRWAGIEKQAALHALDAAGLQALCTETLATSAARHPGNEDAALYSAANRLLLHLGSTLKPEDVQRFEAALKSGGRRAKGVESKPAKRGGKADPAPVPA